MKTIESRSRAILEGNVWKVILLIALPMAIQNLLQAIYSLLDTVFATELGKEVVAGISYISPANNLVIAIGTGLSVAATTMIARKIALNEKEAYKTYVGNSLMFIAITGLIISFLGLGFSEELVRYFKVSDSQYIYAEEYLRLFMLFSPISLLNGMYLSIKRADGNSKLIFITAIINVVVKFTLNWIFIYKLHLGLSSLVYSTAITNGIIVVYGMFDLLLTGDLLVQAKHFKLEPVFLKAMLFMGFPVAIEKSVLQFGHLITHYYAESAGIMAAYGMGNKINNITLSLLGGVGMAVAPIISQNVAKENYKRIKETMIKASIFNACLGLIVSIGLFLLIEPIYKGMSTDLELMSSIKKGYVFIGGATFFWGVMQVMLGTFHGFGKTKYNLIFAMVRLYLIRLPIILMIYYFTAYKQMSVWIGSGASNFLGAFVAVFIALYKLPQKRRNDDYTRY